MKNKIYKKRFLRSCLKSNESVMLSSRRTKCSEVVQYCINFTSYLSARREQDSQRDAGVTVFKPFLIITFSLLIALSGCNVDEKPLANTEKEQQSTETVKTGDGDKGEVTDDVEPDKKEKLDETKEEKTEKPKNEKSGIESIYTDLDESKCKTTDSNEEEEWSVQECPGVSGYKLEVTEGDLRQTINVIAPNGKYELDYQKNVSPAFSTLGKKAEWRVKKVDGKDQVIGLITRFNVNDKPDNPEKSTSYLVVTKFDGEFVCITDVVKPIKNANLKARELADIAASKPCLKGNAN